MGESRMVEGSYRTYDTPERRGYWGGENRYGLQLGTNRGLELQLPKETILFEDTTSGIPTVQEPCLPWEAFLFLWQADAGDGPLLHAASGGFTDRHPIYFSATITYTHGTLLVSEQVVAAWKRLQTVLRQAADTSGPPKEDDEGLLKAWYDIVDEEIDSMIRSLGLDWDNLPPIPR